MNFLLINFPPGAGGRFLSSVLMASRNISHFDPIIEQEKTNSKCLKYVQSHFTANVKEWLSREPKHIPAWNLHFISSKYDRGNELSQTEFLHLCDQHGTDHFHKSVREKKLIIVPWHKLVIPEFFEDALKITILVDIDSVDWFDNSLWYKHYDIIDGKVFLRENDPQSDPSMRQYFLQYNNPLFAEESVEKFYQKNITNNPNKLLFSESENFSSRKNNICINLSDMLNENQFIIMMSKIVKRLEIDPLNEHFLRAAHQHWIGCHTFKYAKNS
jgi:hypothetical protein